MVVAATSTRKRSLMPAGKLRRALRGHGHALQALVQIGKSGVTAPVLRQLAHALFDHELVKVKIGSECPEDRFAVADKLAAEPGTNVVQIIGRTVLVYKRHPQSPKFEGPRAREAAGGDTDPAAALAGEATGRAKPKRTGKARGTRRSSEPRRGARGRGSRS